MANWSGVTGNVSTVELSNLNSMISNRTYSSQEGAMAGYSVVGMNASQITSMQNAINVYIGDVLNITNKLAALDASGGVKGELIDVRLKEYIEAVKKYINNLIYQLSAFNEQIDSVHKQWIASTSSKGEEMATDISSIEEVASIGSGSVN